MISDKMATALNKQINAELYSAYLYMSMSADALHGGLKGAANWFRVQAQEEMMHAQKFYDYVNSQGARVVLAAIDGPPDKFKTLQNMFEEALKHEQKVTGLIHKLASMARSEDDHATGNFLQWFVTEQVEEELNTSTIANQLKIAGNAPNALFMIDRELAARVFTPPPQLQV